MCICVKVFMCVCVYLCASVFACVSDISPSYIGTILIQKKKSFICVLTFVCLLVSQDDMSQSSTNPGFVSQTETESTGFGFVLFRQ